MRVNIVNRILQKKLFFTHAKNVFEMGGLLG